MESMILGLAILCFFSIPIIALVDYQIFKWVPCPHCGKKLLYDRWHFIVPCFIETSCFMVGIVVGIVWGMVLYGS